MAMNESFSKRMYEIAPQNFKQENARSTQNIEFQNPLLLENSTDSIAKMENQTEPDRHKYGIQQEHEYYEEEKENALGPEEMAKLESIQMKVKEY